jgi:hypothetical protein
MMISDNGQLTVSGRGDQAIAGIDRFEAATIHQ